MTKVQEIVLDANRQVNDAYRELLGDKHVERMYVDATMPRKPTQKRVDLNHQAVTKVRADVHAALLQLDRQEADTLRSLAMGALESEAAHAFLRSIPTVAELVPAARLAELEASLTDEDLS